MSNRNKKKKRDRKRRERAKPVRQAALVQRDSALKQTIGQAVQYHQAGDLAQAEGLYRQVLQTDPDQPDALHLLGAIAQRVGKNEQAVELISQAIAAKPDYAVAHYNLGNSLYRLRANGECGGQLSQGAGDCARPRKIAQQPGLRVREKII